MPDKNDNTTDEQQKLFTNQGHDKKNGRFLPGNKCSTGNGIGKRQWKSNILTMAIIDCVTKENVRRIARALLKKAYRGDVRAAQEILDRVLGKSVSKVELEAIFQAADSKEDRIQMLSTEDLLKLAMGEKMEDLN